MGRNSSIKLFENFWIQIEKLQCLSSIWRKVGDSLNNLYEFVHNCNTDLIDTFGIIFFWSFIIIFFGIFITFLFPYFESEKKCIKEFRKKVMKSNAILGMLTRCLSLLREAKLKNIQRKVRLKYSFFCKLSDTEYEPNLPKPTISQETVKTNLSINLKDKPSLGMVAKKKSLQTRSQVPLSARSLNKIKAEMGNTYTVKNKNSKKNLTDSITSPPIELRKPSKSVISSKRSLLGSHSFNSQKSCLSESCKSSYFELGSQRKLTPRVSPKKLAATSEKSLLKSISFASQISVSENHKNSNVPCNRPTKSVVKF